MDPRGQDHAQRRPSGKQTARRRGLLAARGSSGSILCSCGPGRTWLLGKGESREAFLVVVFGGERQGSTERLAHKVSYPMVLKRQAGLEMAFRGPWLWMDPLSSRAGGTPMLPEVRLGVRWFVLVLLGQSCTEGLRTEGLAVRMLPVQGAAFWAEHGNVGGQDRSRSTEGLVCQSPLQCSCCSQGPLGPLSSATSRQSVWAPAPTPTSPCVSGCLPCTPGSPSSGGGLPGRLFHWLLASLSLAACVRGSPLSNQLWRWWDQKMGEGFLPVLRRSPLQGLRQGSHSGLVQFKLPISQSRSWGTQQTAPPLSTVCLSPHLVPTHCNSYPVAR